MEQRLNGFHGKCGEMFMIKEIKNKIIHPVSEIKTFEYKHSIFGQNLINSVNPGSQIVDIGKNVVRGNQFRPPVVGGYFLCKFGIEEPRQCRNTTCRRLRCDMRGRLNAQNSPAKLLERLQQRAIIAAKVNNKIAVVESTPGPDRFCVGTKMLL